MLITDKTMKDLAKAVEKCEKKPTAPRSKKVFHLVNRARYWGISQNEIDPIIAPVRKLVFPEVSSL